MRSPQQIVNDPVTCATSAPGVFIAGDIAYGPRLMIHAIASGKQAARSVYRFLRGKEIAPEEVQFHFPIEHYHREKHYERRSRLHIPTLSAEERLKSPSTLVEIGYNEEQARTEAGRCLDCGINTIFDGERCILCGGCVDVCPTVCLKLVTFDRLALSPEFETAARESNLDPADLSAIIKDEERCIRCGLCAEALSHHRHHHGTVQFCQGVEAMSRLDPPRINRRSFLSLASLGSFFAALGTAAAGCSACPILQCCPARCAASNSDHRSSFPLAVKPPSPSRTSYSSVTTQASMRFQAHALIWAAR